MYCVVDLAGQGVTSSTLGGNRSTPVYLRQTLDGEFVPKFEKWLNGYDPEQDKRFMVCTATHHMVRVLKGGKSAAAVLMAKLSSNAVSSRELTYRLYHMCKQKNYAQEARDYDALVQRWPEISGLSRESVSASEGMKPYDNR